MKVARQDSRIAIMMVFIMVVILSARLVFSAYTSGDDGYTTFAALNPKGLWASAQEMAQFQGRFYQLIVYPLAMLPFMTGDLVVINFWRVLTFLFMLYGIARLYMVMLGRPAGLLALILFLGIFDTVGGSYNPFHGLPMWFGVGCGALCLAIAFHIRVVRDGKGISVLSVLFYALALLSYEIAILYLPLFVFITWYCGRNYDLLSARGWMRLLKPTTGHIITTIAYLIAYVVYRHYYPGTYAGAGELDVSSPIRTLKPIVEFSIYGIYWSFSQSGRPTAGLQSIVYALAAGVGLFAAWLACRNTELQEAEATAITLKKVLAGFVILAYVFVPNILFGLTERYRVWAGDGVQFYLGSIYSAITIVLVIGMFFSFLARRKSGKWPIAMASVLGVGFVGLTYANSMNSQSFFAQSELMRNRWQVADWVAREVNKASSEGILPANDISLCGEGFTASEELPVYFRNPDMMADVDIYWSRYFTWRMKRGASYRTHTGNGPCNATINMSYRTRQATLSIGNRTQSIGFDNVGYLAR